MTDPHDTVEPTRSEPTRSEPTRSEPTRSEPTRPELNRSAPDRYEPNRPDSARHEPHRSEQKQSQPNRSEPNRTNPNRSEPNRSETDRSKTDRSEPYHSETCRFESDHSETYRFETYRNLLFSVAYRVLGSAVDAEDVVQDAWIRWSAADRGEVAEPKAYLVRIATNLAMDRLRSARARRETYPGPWLPEPIRTGAGSSPGVEDRTRSRDNAAPVDEVIAAESVSSALLMLLESLSPLERAVFVLREAFGFSHAEIATAVERSEDTVRQAAHRARSHVRARRPRFAAAGNRHREVTERFLAAAGGGDINALMELLAPDVTLWTDGGGRVRQAFRPVTGAEKVATWFAGVGRRAYEGVEPADLVAEITDLNGAPGVVMHGPGRVLATLILDLDAEGRIAAIHNVANPDKLRAVTTGVVHPV